jgi:lipopolysaccharide transport system permease protein
MTALGVGTFICALNVAYRDFQFLAGFLVQLWMYATPVIYPASIVPEKWRWLLYINPMAGMIDGFRFAFLGRPLDLPLLATSLGISVVLFVIGLAYFERVERSFADVI